MSSQLRVSVVIPVNSAAGQLQRCLSSILSQTFSAIEIILAADEDSSPDVMEAAARCARREARVRTIVVGREEKSGLRMAGLRAAAGTHVCFIDPGEWVSPTFVQDLLGACRRHRVPVARCLCVSHARPGAPPVPEPPVSRLLGARTIQRDCVIDASEALLWTPVAGAHIFDRNFLLKHDVAFPSRVRTFDDLAFHAQWAFFARRLAVTAAPLHHRMAAFPGGEAHPSADELFLHFQAFRYLESRLPGRILDGPEYFLFKFQTHDYALSEIDRRLLPEYRTRTAFDLYFRLKPRRAVHYIRVLYKLKSKFGRRALKLYSYYLTLKRDRTNARLTGAAHPRMQ
jgi:glycosyltransferase involved in cell wall biosynthesis